MPTKIPISQQSSCLSCPVRSYAWFESGTEEQTRQREQHRSAQLILEAGEHLFTEGEQHPVSYTLKEGWAICYKQLSSGERQVVYIALPGDFIGFLTDPDETMDYSVMAVTTCLFCAFSTSNMQHLLQSDWTLMRSLMRIQNMQLKACKKQLTVVGQAQAKSRVAAYLLDLIERLESRGFDISQQLDLPLSREHIADSIGITVVHLSRVTVELFEDAVVECRHGKLRVLNREALQVLAV